MHPWLRRKHRSKQRTAAQSEMARLATEQGEPTQSTAAYYPPGTEAPSHIDENKQPRHEVKQLLTNHWDLDTLPRDELEQVLGSSAIDETHCRKK